tara:strand:+ start:1345 stop:2145 length:801 start_codon:yes stop_codon:yes gene_type:complete
MQVKDLVNKSWYSTVGYIDSIEDVRTLERYIKYNLVFLKKFKGIITAINFNPNNPDLRCKNEEVWNKYFDDVIQLESPINRGYNFGVADLDNLVVDYCKKHNLEFICKSDNDMLLELGFLENNIEESDFYYFNGVGFGGLQSYDFDLERVFNEEFFPQTNFYFINVSKIDYLNDKEYLDETYNQVQSIENYNGKIWEYFEGWTCEKFLSNCIERNGLSKSHLIQDATYRKLLKHIFDNRIIDCSHKNIMIEGICHYHFPDKPVIVI